MNERYTVIIPEHNRPERLRRLLDYLLQYECRVVVSDSSNKRFKYEHQYSGLIDYLFFPNSHLAEKLVKIENLIKTPYVVMCADDDFVIPYTINKIIDFLEEHSDYSSGQGLYVHCDVADCDKYVLKESYPQLYDNSLYEDDDAQRVLHLGRNYYQFYYAVYRKELFFETFNKITDTNGFSLIKNLCVLEMYMAMYSAAHSKHYIINELSNVREYISNSAGKWVTNLYELKAKNQCQEEFEILFKTVDSIIQPIQPNKSVAKIALELYFSKYFSTNKKKSSLYYIQRLFHRLFIYFSEKKSWNNFVNKWENKEKDLEELNIVLSYIKKYMYLTVLEDN